MIDHLIIASPTLSSGIDFIEKKLGVRPVMGGQHIGRGTHNALLALGKNTYLEVIAPDPSQPNVHRPLWMKTDQSTNAQLWTWAGRSSDLQSLSDIAKQYHIPFGKLEKGNRNQTNGNILKWELSVPVLQNAEGLLPFFIDWGNTIHPSNTLPQAGEVVEFKAFHPSASKVQLQLEQLGVSLKVEISDVARLTVSIKRLDGEIVSL